jgi:hypothetical protein
MVEIRYRGRYEAADLAGRPISEVREQYRSELGIPDKARARLNGKKIGGKQESKTVLGGSDRLSFEDRSRRGLFLVGAVMLALVITGTLFAQTATTATVTLTLTGKSDFAAVTAAGSPPTWNVWGSYKGNMTAGDLFTITPETDFTGDMVAMITLTNASDLVSAYRVMVFEIEIYDSAGTPAQVGTTEYLTLTRGDITIEIDQTGHTAPYTVEITGGNYMTHRGGWTAGNEDPTILCDVIQKGAM